MSLSDLSKMCAANSNSWPPDRAQWAQGLRGVVAHTGAKDTSGAQGAPAIIWFNAPEYATEEYRRYPTEAILLHRKEDGDDDVEGSLRQGVEVTLEASWDMDAQGRYLWTARKVRIWQKEQVEEEAAGSCSGKTSRAEDPPVEESSSDEEEGTPFAVVWEGSHKEKQEEEQAPELQDQVEEGQAPPPVPVALLRSAALTEIPSAKEAEEMEADPVVDIDDVVLDWSVYDSRGVRIRSY